MEKEKKLKIKYMAHYICTGGCGGESDDPGTCNNQSCVKYHQLLTVCHCSDSHHDEAFNNPNVATDIEKTEKL